MVTSVVYAVVEAVVSIALSYAVSALTSDHSNHKGPQLSNLNVQVSTYGKAIQQLYGGTRVAGNVIWAAPLISSAHTSGGGKGGGGPSFTNYTYSADFAVSLCSTTGADGTNRPIAGVGRIWADGNLIYNGSSTDPGTIIAGNASTPTVYLGTETQNPDPLMQAYLGAANVPAYRGQAYIVFTNLQLANYGNRIPNIEVEVISGASLTNSAATLATTVEGTYAIAVKAIGTFLYSSSVLNGSYLQNYSLQNQGMPQYSAHSTTIFNMNDAVASGAYIVAADPQNNRLNFTYQSLVLSTYAAVVCSRLAVKNDTVFVADVGLNTVSAIMVAASVSRTDNIPTVAMSMNTINSPKYLRISGNLLVVGGTSGMLATYDVTNETNFAYIGQVTLPLGDTIIAIHAESTVAYIAGISGILYRYSITLNSAPTIIDSISLSSLATCEIIRIGQYLVCIGGKNIIMVSESPSGGMSVATNIVDSTKNYISASAIKNYIYALDFKGDSFGSNIVTLFCSIGVITSNGIPLGTIVQDLCNQVGATSLDTSQLTDMVDGYIVGSQMTARAAIEPLQRAYFFDAVESDNKIKFIKRGINAPIVISEDDLAAHDAQTKSVPATVDLTRTQELDLPRVVNVSYYNTGNNYLFGAQRALRQVTNSSNTIDMQLPICMSDSKAKQTADVNMYVAWTSRNATKLLTSRKYSYLDPSDVVQINKANGITYRLLLTKRVEKANGVIEWEAIADDPSIYTQTAAASTPSITISNTIGYAGNTHCELLDIPIMRDADNDAGFYTAADGYSSGWNGGALVKSADGGATYSVLETFPSPGAVLGTATTVLGNFTGGNTFDETNIVTVIVDSGTLASVTTLNVLNGSNYAVLGNEIIQYRTATLTAANTYILSGLLRGRFGTEQYIGTHAASDRFIHMDVTTAQRVSPALSEVGLSRSYKAISNGQLFSAVSAKLFTNNANGLKPLSPVQIGGGRDGGGNLTINWTRRTRIGGSWNNYSDVPLGESTESYSIDIMSGSTVKRTLTSATPTIAYTSAMQVTDFGANQSSVTVNIYQISASVGRGFAGVATI